MRQGGKAETEKASFEELRGKSGGRRSKRHDEYDVGQGQDKGRQSSKSLNRARNPELRLTDASKDRAKQRANKRAGEAGRDRSPGAREQNYAATGNSSEEEEHEFARREGRSYAKSHNATKSRQKRHQKQIEYYDEEDEEDEDSEDRSR